MSEILWQPSTQAIQSSSMYAFMQAVNREFNLALNDYDQLYQWSVDNNADFWAFYAEFSPIIWRKPWQQVLQHANNIEQARWFDGARLNFAENCLSRRDEKTALVFINELGDRSTLTYQQLWQQVAQVAGKLKQLGIKKGDRVAGFLPNMPETIIAMLASASLGAIWSSCSPDFGVHGVVDRFSQIEPKILFTCHSQQYMGKHHDILQKVWEIAPQLPSLQQIVVVPYLDQALNLKQHPLAVSYDDFKVDTDDIEFVDVAFNDPLYIMYSSGTTGKPKCIVHGVGGTLLQHMKELQLHTNISADDIFLYFTTTGWMMWNWMVSALALQATLVLYDGAPMHPKRRILFDILQQEKISVFGTSAKYLAAMEKIRVKPNQQYQLSSLRTILSTGSPLSPRSFDYVYQHIKSDVQLSSISGGTDIVSCFALGNPMLPVYRGELQCRGLGLAVTIFDPQGHDIFNQKGELVCTQSFPCQPIYFWADSDGKKYHDAYFSTFKNVWAHGDYAQLTEHGGIIIHGRSDTVLNPGGVRIGTAEIYRQVEAFDQVMESLVVGQAWKDDVRVILFVVLRDELILTDELIKQIKDRIKENASPRHVPAKILQIQEIPKTISGKIVELAVKNIIENKPVNNLDAIANPEALQQFKMIPELLN